MSCSSYRTDTMQLFTEPFTYDPVTWLPQLTAPSANACVTIERVLVEGRSWRHSKRTQEKNEVDAKSLFNLARLPVGAAAAALQVLAEPAYLIGERFVSRRAHEKLTYPPYKIRRCARAYQLRLSMYSPNWCSDDPALAASLHPPRSEGCATREAVPYPLTALGRLPLVNHETDCQLPFDTAHRDARNWRLPVSPEFPCSSATSRKASFLGTAINSPPENALPLRQDTDRAR